jgi:menaquinone-dependent protoporphyrinogen oxidase
MVFRLMGCRYGDFRDWPAIDRWAVEIADALDNRTSAIDVTDAEQR